jgi:hypothetical protein
MNPIPIIKRPHRPAGRDFSYLPHPYCHYRYPYCHYRYPYCHYRSGRQRFLVPAAAPACPDAKAQRRSTRRRWATWASGSSRVSTDGGSMASKQASREAFDVAARQVTSGGCGWLQGRMQHTPGAVWPVLLLRKGLRMHPESKRYVLLRGGSARTRDRQTRPPFQASRFEA